jgi:hypothetical protein
MKIKEIMKKTFWSILFTLFAGLTFSQNVVTFYQDCGYGGYGVSLPAGTYNYPRMLEMGIRNDDVSSLRVSSGYKVTLYVDDFSGSTRVYTSDIDCLAGPENFNDVVSSFKIEAVTPPPPPPASNGVATFYSNCNYGGLAISLPTGNYTLAQLQARGIRNDDIDAVRVSSGYMATLYSEDNFTGDSRVFTSDFYCLINASHFENVTTSLRVQKAGAASASPNVATFYSNCNYIGKAVSLPVGAYTFNELLARGISNDDIDAIKVTPGYKVTLYADHNFKGDSRVFTGDYPCFLSNNFANVTTSLIIESASQLFSNGFYTIMSAGSPLFLAPKQEFDDNIDPVVVDGQGPWVWGFEHLGNNVYQISGFDAPPYINLEVKDGLQSNGARVQTANGNTQLARQRWKIIAKGDGGYYIQPFGGGFRTLDLPVKGHLQPVVITETDLNRNQVWKILARESDGATFYPHCNYGGTPVALPPGTYTLAQLKSWGINNDDIDALRVRSGYVVILHSEDNFGGDSRTFTADARCLLDVNFANVTTSLEIQPFATGYGRGLANATGVSNTVTETISPAENTLPIKTLFITPNPANGSATLNCKSDKAGAMLVEVAGMAGNVLRKQVFQVVPGMNRLPLNLEGLTAGTYLVSVYNTGKRETVKLVVQR